MVVSPLITVLTACSFLLALEETFSLLYKSVAQRSSILVQFVISDQLKSYRRWFSTSSRTEIYIFYTKQIQPSADKVEIVSLKRSINQNTKHFALISSKNAWSKEAVYSLAGREFQNLASRASFECLEFQSVKISTVSCSVRWNIVVDKLKVSSKWIRQKLWLSWQTWTSAPYSFIYDFSWSK